MPLTITHSAKGRPTAEGFIFALFAKENIHNHPFYKLLSSANQRYLRTFITKGFRNDKGDVAYVVFPGGKPATAFLVGLGPKKEWSRKRFMFFIRRFVSIAGTEKVPSLALHFSSLAFPESTMPDMTQMAVVNLLMAEYKFGKYQKPDKKQQSLKFVELVVPDDAKNSTAFGFGKVIAAHVNLCRDWANTPAGDMTPSLLAQNATDLAKATSCSIRVLDRMAMGKEKMNAILGVSKGSVEEPQFIIMEYKGGNKTDAPLVFVGKGVTFDSGGINLKSTSSLSEMHMDMSGGAAALCATAAIAEMKLPVNVVALVPAVENMPSGSGYRPGDVLTSRSGVTIEVGNTDAEGRVILSDALDFAKQYKPHIIVDLATLTGSAMVALGQRMAGLFTPNDDLAAEFVQYGERTGDYLWRLPMTEEYEEEIKGTFADINNSSKARYGDAIHGALFLKRFVGNFPWVHLDIAPTMSSTDGQFLAKGATGTGVRILVALAEARAKQKAERTKQKSGITPPSLPLSVLSLRSDSEGQE